MSTVSCSDLDAAAKVGPGGYTPPVTVVRVISMYTCVIYTCVNVRTVSCANGLTFGLILIIMLVLVLVGCHEAGFVWQHPAQKLL